MIRNLGYFLGTPPAWCALFSWPKFSVTSFRMVSSMARQGITPKTVIDIGANVGQFAVASAKIFSGVTIHSFEPLPEAVKTLTKNVSTFHRVHVHATALGERRAKMTLHVNSHSHSSSILALGERHRRAFPRAREISIIEVPVSTLDDEMSFVSFERPVLLKMDVQGYEPRVLEGATETLKRVDYVLLEASFRPLYEGEKTFMEIAEMMQDRGFAFLRPVDWLTDPGNGEILQMDALFERCKSDAQCVS